MTTLLDATPVPAPTFRERHPLAVQLARYAVAGGIGTLVNAVVFLTLRTWWDLLPANLAALAVSTLVSTEVNRRFTFSGEHGHRWRAHVQTAAMVTFYAVYSSAILLALHAVVAEPTPLLESVTVSVASVLGGAGRFLLLRFWVFDRPGPSAWHGVPMGHTIAKRTIAAAVVGTALVLSSAGACGPTEVGNAPGLEQQDGGDDQDDDDQGGDDQDDDDQGGDDDGDDG